MPTKRMNKKNRRRIAAAERSLSRVVRVPALTRRTRKAKSQPIPRAVIDDISRYIASVRDDYLEPGLHLPSNNYTGPYSTRTYKQRVQLQLANTANLHASFICNPYMLWMDNFIYEKDVAGADTLVTIPTAYVNTTASTSPGLPTATAPAGGSGITAVTMQGAIVNGTATKYSGWVRCHGVKMKIYYAGTFNNRGGTLACVTNPQQVALAMQYEAGTAANQPATVFANAGEIEDSPDVSQLVTIGDQFEFVWRPRNLDFVHIDGFKSLDLAPVAASNSGNPAVDEYLPAESNGAPVAEKGWVCGFNLSPAAGTLATTSNYWLEVEACYDLHIMKSSDAVAGITAIPADTVGHQDPIATARAHNALAALHYSRQHSAHVPQRTNLGIVAKAEQYGKKALGGAITGLAESAASRLAAMF